MWTNGCAAGGARGPGRCHGLRAPVCLACLAVQAGGFVDLVGVRPWPRPGPGRRQPVQPVPFLEIPARLLGTALVLPCPCGTAVLPDQRGDEVDVVLGVAYGEPTARRDRPPCGARPTAAMTSPAICAHWASVRIRSVEWLRIEQCHTVFAGALRAAATGCSSSSVSRRTLRRPLPAVGGSSSARVGASSQAATRRGLSCASCLPGPNRYCRRRPTVRPRGWTAGITGSTGAPQR
jgi:hypothetical protein